MLPQPNTIRITCRPCWTYIAGGIAWSSCFRGFHIEHLSETAYVEVRAPPPRPLRAGNTTTTIKHAMMSRIRSEQRRSQALERDCDKAEEKLEEVFDSARAPKLSSYTRLRVSRCARLRLDHRAHCSLVTSLQPSPDTPHATATLHRRGSTTPRLMYRHDRAAPSKSLQYALILPTCHGTARRVHARLARPVEVGGARFSGNKQSRYQII